MPDCAHKQIGSNAVAKALLTLAASIAEAADADFADRMTGYLSNIANSAGCDAETSDLLADLILVIQPPVPTPRRKFQLIQGGAA
jgi:hypothetical protein